MWPCLLLFADLSYAITASFAEVVVDGDIHPLTLEYTLPTANGNAPIDGYPVVVALHGGSWNSGEPEDMKDYTDILSDNGFITVRASYRYTVQNVGSHSGVRFPYPAQLNDTKCALRWVRKQAALYALNKGSGLNINVNQIAVMGFSAGAHLALLSDLVDDEFLPEQSAVTARPYDVTCFADETSSDGETIHLYTSEVQAIVALAPPTDLLTNYCVTPNLIQSALRDLAGRETTGWVCDSEARKQGYPSGDPEDDIWEEMSPFHLLRRSDTKGAPTLLLAGLRDTFVSTMTARLYDRLLDAKGWAHKLIVHGRGHNFLTLGIDFPNYLMEESMKFLEENMLSGTVASYQCQPYPECVNEYTIEDGILVDYATIHHASEPGDANNPPGIRRLTMSIDRRSSLFSWIRTPAVVLLHAGEGSWGTHTIPWALRLKLFFSGYVVATPNVRRAELKNPDGSTRYPWPASLHDAKCAVKYMRAHADSLGVHPDKIAVVGLGRMGGHLALMTALTGDMAEYEGACAHEASSAVQSVVSINGAPDLAKAYCQYHQSGTGQIWFDSRWSLSQHLDTHLSDYNLNDIEAGTNNVGSLCVVPTAFEPLEHQLQVSPIRLASPAQVPVMQIFGSKNEDNNLKTSKEEFYDFHEYLKGKGIAARVLELTEAHYGQKLWRTQLDFLTERSATTLSEDTTIAESELVDFLNGSLKGWPESDYCEVYPDCLQ